MGMSTWKELMNYPTSFTQNIEQQFFMVRRGPSKDVEKSTSWPRMWIKKAWRNPNG
jgi:hypothetical protein